MAEFQFYRPQVNPLERLWAQYAEAQGAKGGAFLRGLAPGLEAMGKNYFEQRNIIAEREFRTAEREAAEAAAAKREAARLDRDQQIATERINAEKQQAQDEEARKLQQTEAVLIGVGVPQDEARELAKELGDPQTANMWADNRRDVEAKAAQTAALKKQEERQKKQKEELEAGLTRGDALGAFTPTQRENFRSRIDSSDPSDYPGLLEEIGSLNLEADRRTSLLQATDRLQSQLKELEKGGAMLVSPSNLEAYTKATSLMDGAVAKLRDKKWMATASPEEKSRIANLIADQGFEIRRLTGMVGARDPEYVAQVAKQYPGLERLMGKNVLYNGGYINGTPQQNASFQKLRNDRVRDDFELQQELKSLNVSDPAAILASIAAGVPLTVPDDSGRIAQVISKHKERIDRQLLEELDIKVQSVPVPSGYRDVRALSPEERSAFRADFAAAAKEFSFAKGRLPTMQEGQQIAANLGYWDINAPTLRKIEPKAAEAKKAETKPQPKAAEQQPAKPASKPAEQKPAEAKKAAAPEKKPAVAQAPAGPPAGPPPPVAALAGVLALPEGRLHMPSKEEAKAIAQERELETRRILYGNSQRTLLEGIVSPRAPMPAGPSIDFQQRAFSEQAKQVREAGEVVQRYPSGRWERAQAMRMPAGSGPVINLPSNQRLLPPSPSAPSTTAPYFRAMRPIGPMLR